MACTGSAREPGDLALQLGPFNMTWAMIMERLGDSFDHSLFLHKFKSKCIKPSLTSIFLWYEQNENTNKLGQFSIAQYIDEQSICTEKDALIFLFSFWDFSRSNLLLGIWHVLVLVNNVFINVFFPISIPPTVALLSIFKARSSSERSGKCWRKTARECSCKCGKNSKCRTNLLLSCLFSESSGV